MLTITRVGEPDLPVLMPMLRAYCDFYRVDPPDDRLLALANALIDNPAEGLQLIARDDGTPIGFATIYWTWETAPDNVTAQRLYDGIGAEKSTWLAYEIDA